MSNLSRSFRPFKEIIREQDEKVTSLTFINWVFISSREGTTLVADSISWKEIHLLDRATNDDTRILTPHT